MDRHPSAEKALRVAAYCRVSTRQEEQDGSIKQQEQYYAQFISGNPNWTNAGVFSERVSGLRMKDRPAFQSMMKLCHRGKIDLILIKSFSRLGRNTLDMLRVLRELKELGVDVHFEEENLWLHDERMEMLIAVFCAFAQSESENMSQNIRWGVRQGFRMGTSGYADFVCYGYKRGDDGRLAIDEPDAEIVRRIFQMRAEGKSVGAISDWLYESKISSPTGKERWSRETISKLLRNEKYLGDVLLQKTFVKDVLTGKQFKNCGELERYLIQQHHPAIVSRELFDRVN
ncbi:MAG: recombinase family protein [Clostridiales bacterium]|nr:recombinase family protein [Clostridiales bacterium]